MPSQLMDSVPLSPRRVTTARGSASESRDTRRGPAGTLVSYYTRQIRGKPFAERAPIRQQVVKLLTETNSLDACTDEFIKICVGEGGPTGIDLAVDVLSKIGTRLLEYAWGYLHRDLLNLKGGRPYEPNDDYWYVLLRAVARVHDDERSRFRFISCCKEAESRGVREGVVEGFRDLGTAAAIKQVKWFAEHDADSFIRGIAKEALDDMEI